MGPGSSSSYGECTPGKHLHSNDLLCCDASVERGETPLCVPVNTRLMHDNAVRCIDKEYGSNLAEESCSWLKDIAQTAVREEGGAK